MTRGTAAAILLPGSIAEPAGRYAGPIFFNVVFLRTDGRRRSRADVQIDRPVQGQVSTEETGACYGVIAALWLAWIEHSTSISCDRP